MNILRRQQLIHFYFFSRYDTTSIEEEGVQSWCERIWKEKESHLKDFYNRNACFATEKRNYRQKTHRVTLIVALLCWISFTIVSLLMCFLSKIVLTVFLSHFLLLVFLQVHGEGYDALQVEIHDFLTAYFTL